MLRERYERILKPAYEKLIKEYNEEEIERRQKNGKIIIKWRGTGCLRCAAACAAGRLCCGGIIWIFKIIINNCNIICRTNS